MVSDHRGLNLSSAGYQGTSVGFSYLRSTSAADLQNGGYFVGSVGNVIEVYMIKGW